MALQRSSIAAKGLLILSIPVISQLFMLVITAVVDQVRQADVVRELESKELNASVHRIRGLLVDIETSIRGYALTGQMTFLQPYDRATARLPGELDRLLRLVRSGHYAVNADEIERVVSRFARYQGEQRHLIATGQTAAAVQRIRAQTGKRIMDSARQLLDSLMREHNRMDAARAAASRRSRTWLTTAIVANVVLTVIIGLIAGTLFVRSVSQRLATVVENTARLEEGLPLHPRLAGGDEIAELDDSFHSMAAALAANKRDLESSNEQLEAFSYSVSHDLRSPLRAIDGYALMLQEDYGQRMPAEGQRYISVIRGEARRMSILIDDLLAFSRLGRTSIALGTLDLGTMAAAIVRDLQQQSDQPIDLRTGSLPEALGDAAMVRQALTNLLSNAVKFSRGRERIVIEMDGRQQDGWCEFSLRDHGVGFDPRHAGKLFGVFHRLHSDTEFEGTGVGLAIVKRVIERHGGRVRAEGAPGQGATFWFTLPAESRVGA